MPSFLKDSFLNNPISSYLWILAIIVAMLLFKGIISRLLCGFLYRLFPGAKKYVSRNQFVSLVLVPMQWFIVWTVIVFSLDKLNFPEAFKFELYKISTQQIAEAAGKTILIVFFVRLLTRLIDFFALIFEVKANQTADQSDNQLVVFFKDFFKALAVILGALLVTRFVFHFNIANLITGLSIVTAAIALSTRESLENLIASFIIFFDKPFTAGDLVKVESITGTIEKIGLRSTRIRTDQKTYVTMPNKKMVDSILDNLTLRTQRKAEIKLELHVSTPPSKIENLIQKVEVLLQQVEEIENSSVVLTEVGLKSVTVSVEFFTPHIEFAKFQQIKQDVNLNLLRFVESLEIILAGGKTD
ncbi:MAG: mechanosensitive ion channel family protein [Chitinophagaceae bacterium]|nr:mechanosensitive ion channel family protein [Chitinophagaceae bacterium]